MSIGIKFSVMRNIMNNEFKQTREITENGNRSVVAHSDMIVSSKYGYNSSFFPCTRKILLVKLKLNICLRIGIIIIVIIIIYWHFFGNIHYLNTAFVS
jgi:hypothetical protein